MSVPPPIAAFGVTPLDKGLTKKSESRQPRSKYEDFLGAIHAIAFSEKNVDMQTRLEWDNIEGEVMAEVLAADLASATMFTQVEDNLFEFETPGDYVSDLFAKEIAKQYVELANQRPHFVPSITVMKRKVNELVISLGGLGREELIRMLQSFQVSMQESERSDAMVKGLMRGR